jgi:hypothetical protein
MNTLRSALAATALIAALVAAQTGHAAPMKCSGEEATCREACAKAAKTTLSACLTACGVRRSNCMRSGCWDNGRQRYCGLAKQ